MFSENGKVTCPISSTEISSTRKDVDLPITVFDWTVYLIQLHFSIINLPDKLIFIQLIASLMIIV